MSRAGRHDEMVATFTTVLPLVSPGRLLATFSAWFSAFFSFEKGYIQANIESELRCQERTGGEDQGQVSLIVP